MAKSVFRTLMADRGRLTKTSNLQRTRIQSSSQIYWLSPICGDYRKWAS